MIDDDILIMYIVAPVLALFTWLVFRILSWFKF